MSETLLELSGIDKVFPGVRALKEAQFNVRRGEVHALIGENGAGKSTLIKIVSGVYQPDSGEIRLDGAPIEFSNPREAHSAGIATIYQELGLYPELSVAENIFMGHAPTKKRLGFETIDWEGMEAGAEALLADLNIHNLDVGAKVGALNVGNRQRVEIAKALSLDAQILIMDEPTAALTESDVEQLFSIVRLLRERGVSIIYISHRLNEVFELADRVTVLRDGEYIGTHHVADTRRIRVDQHDGGAPDREPLPQASGADRRCSAGRAQPQPPAADARYLLLGARRRDRRAGRPGRLRPQRDGPGDLRRAAGGVGRDPAQWRTGQDHAAVGSGRLRHRLRARRPRASRLDPRDDHPREHLHGRAGIRLQQQFCQPQQKSERWPTVRSSS